MSIGGAIVSFVIIWWLVLLPVLSVGLQTQGEKGEVEPGTPESAPATPQLVRKMLMTTAVTLVLWGSLFAAMEFQLISLSDLDFLPGPNPDNP